MERSNLSAVRYWSESQERVAQRFYIAFCLLMSSVQDCILGEKERNSHNFNWSATCSYYSLVHGGRLLCFLALGDYPKHHAKLRDIFLTHHVQRLSNSTSLDWLRGFVALSGQPPLPRRGSQSNPEHLQVISEYLDYIGISQYEERLNNFGTVLSAAAQLRNDSNYEALLIAHEYQHIMMSDAFQDLSDNMASVASSQLYFFIDAFNGFRAWDPHLPENRQDYEAFLYDYTHHRIRNAILNKLDHSADLVLRLDSIIARIGTSNTGVEYNHLEELVSIAILGSKAQLMRDFRERINNLTTTLKR